MRVPSGLAKNLSLLVMLLFLASALTSCSCGDDDDDDDGGTGTDDDADDDVDDDADDDTGDDDTGDDDTGDDDTGDDDTAGDTTPPEITHTPITDYSLEGDDVVVDAGVTDDSGVASVNLYYRTSGAAAWTSMAMTETKADYTATIDGADVEQPGLEYYIEATDSSDNANVGYNPADGETNPYAFDVFCTGTGESLKRHNGTAGAYMQEFVDAGSYLGVLLEATDVFTVNEVSHLFHTYGANACAADPFTAEIWSNAADDDEPDTLLTASDSEDVETGSNCADTSAHVFTLLDPVRFEAGADFWVIIKFDDDAEVMTVMLDNADSLPDYSYLYATWLDPDFMSVFDRTAHHYEAMSEALGCLE